MKNKIKYNKYDQHCNGSKTKYEYNANNFRLTRLLTTRNTGIDILQDINYTYDPEGNIVEIIDNSQQTHYFDNAVIEPKSLYEYDALYRLKKATGRELSSLQMPSNNDFANNIATPNTASDAMQNYTQQFVYDELGNIKQMQSVGNWTRDYFYNTNNNYLLGHTDGTTEYTYDAHGNMLTMPHLSSMLWNYKDELKEVTLNASGDKAYYVYDSSGERVRKVIEKGNIIEERYYLGDYEVYRKTTNGTLDIERETVHISDDKKRIALVETKTGESAVIRYQYDNHLGSASLELNDNAEIISYEEYHPFGTTSYRSGRNEIDVSLKRYKYVHKELDNETGLYYYGMRYYAPWIAMFISVDPLQFKYPELTPFQYTSNNPSSDIDVDGLEGTKAAKKKENKIKKNLFYATEALSNIHFSIRNRINSGLYDKNYWHLEEQLSNKGVLRINEGASPSKGLKSIIKEPENYSIDCAEFVRIVQHYALYKELGKKKYDKEVKDDFYIFSYWNAHLKFEHSYKRSDPNLPFWDDLTISELHDYAREYKKSYAGEYLNVEVLINEIPLGSNIAITNIDAPDDADFKNENLIKLGDNLWGAHGWGERGDSKIFTLDKVKKLMAETTKDNPSAEYIENKIFISKIEILNILNYNE